ncbi:MAG: hypothetical protein QOJ18_555 [Microbacteriaceae bacterium]|jgi:RNA polymerase sigma-70 factor (sigma-E family)|nr:hypothetical protein [Microbacteriaceae bacterium]
MPDAVAFEAFVRTNSRTLFGTAYLLTGDPGAAEELLQDTLARLYPKWASVQSATSQVAYVRRAIANRFISSKRSRDARDISAWEAPELADADDVASTVTDRRMLWQLLATLPERQRAAIVLRFFHDLPDAEIATALDCREVTVRSLVSRGVAAMRGRAFIAERGEHR